MDLSQTLSPLFPTPKTPASGRGGWSAARALMAAGLVATPVLALVPLAHLNTVAGGAAALVAASLAAAFAGNRRVADLVVPVPPPTGVTAPPYDAALEALPDPLMFVSAADANDLSDRRIVFANAAAREMLRLPRQGALVVTALRHPEVLEAIDETLFGGVARDVAYEPSGAHARVWRVRTLPLASPDEHSRLALVHLRDETDSRRAEQMRVDFLANASHELRTPLASLSGFIETLRGHAKDDVEARHQFLRIMAAQAERMARLIDDLMSLSRIELNEHVPTSGACDLMLATKDVVDALQPQISEKGVAIDLRLPPRGEAIIAGDRDQVVQVVQNLLDNALKYSPVGGTVVVEVAVGLTRDEAAVWRAQAPIGVSADGPLTAGGRLPLLTPDRVDHARYTLVRISDSGQGMAREHLPRLAERFYRVEGQKSGERLGTGLGLAIVKHIMNRHRGGLVVESTPGRGSSLSAYFPVAPASFAAIPSAANPGAANESLPSLRIELADLATKTSQNRHVGTAIAAQ